VPDVRESAGVGLSAVEDNLVRAITSFTEIASGGVGQLLHEGGLENIEVLAHESTPGARDGVEVREAFESRPGGGRVESWGVEG
jgi:hypothetical protein